MTNDSRSRKWQITINNPANKGYTHDKIKECLALFTNCLYWCMSDEVGLETHTPHTHVFIACSGAVRFSTLQNRFPECHFEICRGTSQQNRDYVFKEGKYLGSSKEDTRVEGSQEEWGEMPVERQGKRNDLDDLFDMIRSGMTDIQILNTCPEYMLNLPDIQHTRQIVQRDAYENTFRNLHVVYIYGATGTGKTRYVMEKYGYSNVYRVTNYKHPFDGYRGQDVILFDEFRSSLPLGDMLKYLDGYPCDLPSRFSDKHALFTRVYFTTNIPLTDQYSSIQRNESESYNAFIRRIHEVRHYDGMERRTMTIREYLDSLESWRTVKGVELPAGFEERKEESNDEQISFV